MDPLIIKQSGSDRGSVLGVRLRAAISEACADMQPGDEPPSAQATNEFIAQMEEVFPPFASDSRFSFPHVDALGDGSLMAQWGTGKKKILVTFTGDGNGVVTLVDRTGVEPKWNTKPLPDRQFLQSSLEWITVDAPAPT